MKVMHSLLVISLGAVALLWLPQKSPAQNPEDQKQAATAEPRQSGQVVVAYLNGELTIRANNALLCDILSAVREKMGAVLDLPSMPNERMFAILGPGRPREVLSSLLNNAQLDFVFVASADDPRALERIMVFPRAKDSSSPRDQSAKVAQNRETHTESSKPPVSQPQTGSVVDNTGAQQMKEFLAQAKAEIASVVNNDPEIMRLFDEPLKPAEAVQGDPAQIDAQAGSSPPALPVSRPRHRRR